MYSDKVYYPGDPAPEVKACVMHPLLPQSKEVVMEEERVRYGLCEQCIEMLKDNPAFQESIDYEVNRRLEQLHKENVS